MRPMQSTTLCSRCFSITTLQESPAKPALRTPVLVLLRLLSALLGEVGLGIDLTLTSPTMIQSSSSPQPHTCSHIHGRTANHKQALPRCAYSLAKVSHDAKNTRLRCHLCAGGWSYSRVRPSEHVSFNPSTSARPDSSVFSAKNPPPTTTITRLHTANPPPTASQ